MARGGSVRAAAARGSGTNGAALPPGRAAPPYGDERGATRASRDLLSGSPGRQAHDIADGCGRNQSAADGSADAETGAGWVQDGLWPVYTI